MYMDSLDSSSARVFI